MTCCLSQYKGYRVLQKEHTLKKKQQVQAMNTCQSGSMLELTEEKEKTPSGMDRRDWKLGNHLFITQLLLVPEQEEL